MVRNLGGEVLNHLGYEVRLANDGAEAIELYAKPFQIEEVKAVLQEIALAKSA